MSERWDEYFLGMALRSASMSKDPSTKVGAVLTKQVLPGRRPNLLCTGFNGFPHGILDSLDRLNNRELKLEIVVHAEMNAVLTAAALGIATAGSTIYVAATDGTREIWGGPPCVRCTVECMQAGVIAFVSRPVKIAPSRWHESIAKAQALIVEAGLTYREVPLP